MLYKYEAKTKEGESRSGTIEAGNLDLAVSSLQRASLVITSLEPVEKSDWFHKTLTFGSGVKNSDTMLLSRQLATLFSAKVPLVQALKVLGAESQNFALRRHLSDVLNDVQGGLPLSAAFARHPQIFSNFYVHMVRSGEESGKLEQIFNYLADYLERNYELQVKARNALIYPAFVIFVFIGVMTLMLTTIIPKMAEILKDSGQELPIFTKIVIGASDIVRNYGVYLILLITAGAIGAWRYSHTPAGKLAVSRVMINIPIVGTLYRKIYIARFADNLNTLLTGGVAVLRALEITSEVIGNEVYAYIVREAMEQVRSGARISDALSRFDDFPPLVSQMIKIGEETGKLDFILNTLAVFYRREVNGAVDNLISLIEPIMIIVLGLGVGILVAAVLLPIYNIAGSV